MYVKMDLKRVSWPALGLLLALALTGVAHASAPDMPGWHQDLDAAVEEAQKNDAMILVDLYADWCGWCKVLEEKVFLHETFKKYADEKNFVLLRVDTQDGAHGSSLQARFQADSLPTTLVLDQDMVKVGAISGFAPVDTFVRYIDEQLEAWQILLNHYQVVLDEGEAHLQRGLAKDFHSRGAGDKAAALYESVIAKVERGTSAAAWLHYLAADAHRLDRNFDGARTQLEAARKVGVALDGEEELVEKVDLLSFYIAQDAGDCRQAVHSIEAFLEAHPRSFMRREMQRRLADLKESGPACT